MPFDVPTRHLFRRTESQEVSEEHGGVAGKTPKSRGAPTAMAAKNGGRGRAKVRISQ